MSNTEAENLCKQCGLCCNGSIFADVELKNRCEADTLEVLGLEVEEEEQHWVMVQPCRALQGTECSIYPHRPDCCRTFECRVLKEYQLGHIDLMNAIRIVGQVRERISREGTQSIRVMIDRNFLNPVRLLRGHKR